MGPYCRSKLLAEQYAFALAAEGRPVVVANPTMPVGPGDRNLSPPTRLVLDFCQGKLPAVMDCTLNVVDVRDVAHALVLVMHARQAGSAVYPGRANLTLCELLEILSERCGVRVPRLRVPYPAALAFAYASEAWADWASGLAPKATVTGVRLARRIMHFDMAQTQHDLGFTPRQIRESLADLVDWLQYTSLLPPHAGRTAS